MENTISKLRRKYVITAFLLAFSIIAVMIFILNFLMRMTYQNERKIAADIITRSAVSHADTLNTEYYLLSDVEQNEDGDYIIPRDVRKISSITMHGTIKCENGSANWYSAGGGLMFDVETDNGKKLVYQEYAFNKDTANLTINFGNYKNIKFDGKPIAIKEEQIVGDYFLVSIVWWSNSSDAFYGDNSSVSLTVDSVEIRYKEPFHSNQSEQHIVTHDTFSDVFENNIPAVLSNTTAFYLITDDKNQLLSVNSGNMIRQVTDNEAESYLMQSTKSGKHTGKLKIGNSTYSYTIETADDMKVIVFVNNNFTNIASQNLMLISVLVGIAVLIIIFVLIWIISKRVVKPVADNFERQKKFISNASHELKTPITVISTTIDIISRQKGTDRWTECIKNQSKKMQHLVYELLDLSRLSETQTAKQNFKKCDVSRIVSRSLMYFESRFFESNKKLKTDIEKEIFIICDENKISQLVGILVDNALKYSNKESEIEFSIKKNRDSVVISCSNLSKEFSVADTSMLFERFYRSDNDERSEQEGFGLGLSIAKAIIELHSGTIKADYQDEIVNFTIILPME